MTSLDRILEAKPQDIAVALHHEAVLHSRKADNYCLECLVPYPCKFSWTIERMLNGLDRANREQS
jgi:hypothetical protein